jgi:hypothetical protein
MAVNIDIVALVIPIAAIDRVYPGGFSAYLLKNKALNKLLFMHDDFLVRIGAMDDRIISAEAESWKRLGLLGPVWEEDHFRYRDYCIISNWQEVRRGCDWLLVDEQKRTVTWNGRL